MRWQDVDFENGFIHIRQRADAYNQLTLERYRRLFQSPDHQDHQKATAMVEVKPLG